MVASFFQLPLSKTSVYSVNNPRHFDFCRQLALYTGSTGMSFLILHYAKFPTQTLASRMLYSDLAFPFKCSWRTPQCNLWKCNRNDYLHVCAEKWDDSCCPAVATRLDIVKYAAGSWVCFLCWWYCPL
jgi:hypothetical protein